MMNKLYALFLLGCTLAIINGCASRNAEERNVDIQILVEIRPEVNYVTHLYTLAELERMLRNSSDITPESLRETHPDLTKGDIRTYILSHLQFSVSEQAILLGISPASVTKARQRLKAKLI